MTELGRIAILISLIGSLYITVVALVGARKKMPDVISSARNTILFVGVLATIAEVALLYAFYTRDFSLAYVAQYSSRDLSFFFTLSASYAGQEGSLLLWVWVLSMFSVVVIFQNKNRNRLLMPYVMAIMGFIQAFFFVLLAFMSDPFAKLAFVPPDGQGLNPLLQNHGMFFHPTTLYVGYVGFTVPFAFAIAALITGQLGDQWIKSTRRWTLFAWFFLGLGNLFGAQWAYVELGWGGYWGWDPVESASFMPWLTGTAYLHSVMIQQRRAMLKVWNMVLIIVTFALSIFGTFLTRSGVLSSVHTFGASSIGPMFIALLIVILAGSLILLVDRLPLLRAENELDSFMSRESSFLFNNLLLVGAAFAVFWGTVFPLISEAVRGVKVTVQAPFFSQVTGPIFLALVILMGVCPLIGWRRASTENLIRNFLYPFVFAVIAGLAIYFAVGVRETWAAVAFSACTFVTATILLEFYRGTRARHRAAGQNYVQAFLSLVWANKPRYGGYIVHLGIILMAVGIAGEQMYGQEKEVTLSKGQETTIGNFRLVYEGLKEYPTQNKEVTAATIAVYQGGSFLGRLTPSKEFHKGHDQPNTEVAIRTTALEDLYLILNSWDNNGVANFKFIINPLVVWIWIGGVVLLLGTGVAYWPDAREKKRMAMVYSTEAVRGEL